MGPCPETKMKSPARTAGEYGPRGSGTPGGKTRSIIRFSYGAAGVEDHRHRTASARAILEFHTMRFEHVAQRRQRLFGPRRGPFRLRGFAFDNVASAGAADVDEVGFLQAVDEFREASCAVCLLAESGIELQHGGLQ